MWNCQGTPLNFSKPVLGKVIKDGTGVFSRRNQILVTTDPGKLNCMFHAGVITDQPHLGHTDVKLPCVYGVCRSDIEKLQQGDVVLLEPDGRVILIFDVDVNDNALLATERCNCRCVMCPQPPRKDRPGLQELNLKLLHLMDASRTKSMCITGGEPTLLGDGFFQLVNECKECLPRTPLAVLTNGRSFSKFEYARKLVDVGHPDLTLCVALYADQDMIHDEIVGVPGSFYETVKGITNLALFEQKIEIRNVISSYNYGRLPQFADFVYKNFPFSVHVAFMGMEMTGLAAKNIEKVWVDPVDYMAQLTEAVKRLERGNMRVSIYNLQYCIMPPSLWRYSRKSISTWKNEYHDDCNTCNERERCGGFFSTSGNISSRGIKKLD
jgi:His-Xaa-Ser system radical SAM maturase HxsC